MTVPQVVGVIQQVAEWEGRVAEFIRSPDTGNGLVDAAKQSYRKSCDRYSAAPEFLQGLGPSAQSIGRICKPYLDEQGFSLPVREVPFSGGQCVGDSYAVTIQRNLCNGTDNGTFVVGATGPVKGLQELERGTGTLDWYLVSGQPETFSRLAISCSDPNSTSTARRNLSIVSVVNNTNPADDCGDPPAVTKPGPNPAPDPGVEFEPFEDPQDPNFPRFPDPTVYTDPVFGPTPFPSVNIDVGLGGGSGVGGGGSGGIPTGPGTPGNPEETGADGIAEGEAPAGEVLVGVKVEILSAPTPERLARSRDGSVKVGVCYVEMGWPGQLERQTSAVFLASQDFFVAPIESTNWRVSANLGYNLRVTPYYTETIAEV